MTESMINEILDRMKASLTRTQLKLLKSELKVVQKERFTRGKSSDDLLSLFIMAKEVEGCSDKSLEYYRRTLLRMLHVINKPCAQIESDDLRIYLSEYERGRGSSKTTIDNIRRIFSSFFAWLEDEDYIVKSPVRRIHKVKTPQTVKEIIQDEDLESLRDNCINIRDLAIVDLLASTGMRIGELVSLNKNDVNFAERACIVQGKGDKQREVYFDARAKLHLRKYLATRTDNDPALFVSLNKPHKRLQTGGVEIRLRKIGQKLKLPRIYPHKFRRTLATNAIDKGMPVEQVQKLLGHVRIDTTMQYAMVNQSNVKASHRRYLG